MVETMDFTICNSDHNPVFVANDMPDETAALDLYAQYRSGYETFTRMAQSGLFQSIGACDVTALAA